VGGGEALRGAVERMEETAGAGCVEAVEAAMLVEAKHEARSEPLAALVALARDPVEQARAAEAERVRVAAEEAAAAAAVSAAAEVVAAAVRLRLEQELAALTMTAQSSALRIQQVQAQLGVPPAAPAPHPDAEEMMCVVCFDAPKQYAMFGRCTRTAGVSSSHSCNRPVRFIAASGTSHGTGHVEADW
jgi:hypothetical protein